nr:sulfur carrier protein ThiS adenylyltransferase ThiF [Maliibacterium massiliense]
MWVTVNGREMETHALTLCALCDALYGDNADVVRIVGGYQVRGDMPLHDGDSIVFIERGAFPPENCFEQMLAARHTPGVHAKVKRGCVGIAGLGGLGSHIALCLARTGVGTLHLVDSDVVEPSNLNRQQYRIAHLGMRKTEALRAQIAEVNPYVQVVIDSVRVDADNACTLFAQDDIVCEAFDGAEDKAMLVNTLLAERPARRIVAASGMAGYGSCNDIATRRVAGNFYICGDGRTEAAVGCGLMAPRVSVCAGHQANVVLQLLVEGEAR